MGVENEDIIMELVRTLGESNKKLLEQLESIKESLRNSASHDDMVELVKAIYKVQEDTQNIICAVSDSDKNQSVMDVLSRWDTLWSWLLRGKGIIVSIGGVIGLICSIVWVIFKVIELFPLIRHIFY